MFVTLLPSASLHFAGLKACAQSLSIVTLVCLLSTACYCRDTIHSSIGAAAPGKCAPISEVEEVAAELPMGPADEVVDYASDSDLPMMRGDTLARRRSLYHLRDSRRRDSITKM